MKIRLLVLMLALLFNTPNLSAQYCGNSGSTVCNASDDSSNAVFPASEDIPCILRNEDVDTRFNVRKFDSVYYAGITWAVSWMRIDAIENLPEGLCWASNMAYDKFGEGETGCIKISGRTFAEPGQYKLKIYGHVFTAAGVFGPELDFEQFGIEVYLRVINEGSPCLALETSLETIESKPKFILSPNPSAGYIQITADEQLVGKELKVTDVSGRVLLQRIVDAPVMTLQLSGLANGMYLVQVDGSTKRLVKE